MDCNWPFCGCDEHAERVIQALQECDMLKEASPTATPAAPPAAALNMVCLCGDIERMNQMIDIALDIVLIVMLVFCLGALAWGSDG